MMYLTRQANAFTLTGRQAVTALYHGAETLVADPVASTTCGMRCRLQTYSNTPESNPWVTVGVRARLTSSLPSKDG